MGPCSPPQHTHFSLPLRMPHSCWHASASLLDSNPNFGWPRRGLFQEVLCCNARNWGPPSPSARLTLSSGHHTSPSGPHGSFRMGESVEPSEPLASLKAPHANRLWPMPPLPSALNLACHSAHHTAFRSVLWSSWGLTLTQVSTRWALLKWPGATMLGIRDTRSPAPESHCCQATTRA